MANSGLSEVQAANLTANTTASTASSGLNNSFSAVGNTTGIDTGAQKGGLFGFGKVEGTDLAGMNIDQAESTFIPAIRKYVADVNEVLEELKNLSANEAFGQKVGAVVGDYVLSVKNACLSLTSNLEAFCEDILAIKQAYVAKAESISSSVNSTSSDIDSAASQYKYSGGSN